MIRLTDLINENAGNHSYGCAMLYFTFDKMDEVQSLIKQEHIYTEPDDASYGLEEEPHCTLLYGLHDDVTDDNVKSVLQGITFGTCKIHNPSIFETDKYDVLKFEVEGVGIHEANKALMQYPYTTDFPDYHPHMTVGYLQKGYGQKYADLLKQKASEFTLLPEKVVYSHVDDSSTTIPININEQSSTEYYRKNPKARAVKAKTDTKINQRPEQIKKRVESNAKRREAKASGKNIKGKDYDHKQKKFMETAKNRGQTEKSRVKGSKRKKK